MKGPETFKFAVNIVYKATKEVVAAANLELTDIALIIPHQANTRIIKSAARLLDVPMDKFYVNVESYGNTSAASIPIALCEAIDEGCIKDGDRIVLVGFGGGLSWAAMVIEWGPGKNTLNP
jgi:3-oxoacyl-[acyl-carrier-protein] synthase-3